MSSSDNCLKLRDYLLNLILLTEPIMRTYKPVQSGLHTYWQHSNESLTSAKYGATKFHNDKGLLTIEMATIIRHRFERLEGYQKWQRSIEHEQLMMPPVKKRMAQEIANSMTAYAESLLGMHCIIDVTLQRSEPEKSATPTQVKSWDPGYILSWNKDVFEPSFTVLVPPRSNNSTARKETLCLPNSFVILRIEALFAFRSYFNSDARHGDPIFSTNKKQHIMNHLQKFGLRSMYTKEIQSRIIQSISNFFAFDKLLRVVAFDDGNGGQKYILQLGQIHENLSIANNQESQMMEILSSMKITWTNKKVLGLLIGRKLVSQSKKNHNAINDVRSLIATLNDASSLSVVFLSEIQMLQKELSAQTFESKDGNADLVFSHARFIEQLQLLSFRPFEKCELTLAQYICHMYVALFDKERAMVRRVLHGKKTTCQWIPCSIACNFSPLEKTQNARMKCSFSCKYIHDVSIINSGTASPNLSLDSSQVLLYSEISAVMDYNSLVSQQAPDSSDNEEMSSINIDQTLVLRANPALDPNADYIESRIALIQECIQKFIIDTCRFVVVVLEDSNVAFGFIKKAVGQHSGLVKSGLSLFEIELCADGNKKKRIMHTVLPCSNVIFDFELQAACGYGKGKTYSLPYFATSGVDSIICDTKLAEPLLSWQSLFHTKKRISQISKVLAEWPHSILKNGMMASSSDPSAAKFFLRTFDISESSAQHLSGDHTWAEIHNTVFKVELEMYQIFQQEICGKSPDVESNAPDVYIDKLCLRPMWQYKDGIVLQNLHKIISCIVVGKTVSISHKLDWVEARVKAWDHQQSKNMSNVNCGIYFRLAGEALPKRLKSSMVSLPNSNIFFYDEIRSLLKLIGSVNDLNDLRQNPKEIDTAWNNKCKDTYSIFLDELHGHKYRPPSAYNINVMRLMYTCAIEGYKNLAAFFCGANVALDSGTSTIISPLNFRLVNVKCESRSHVILSSKWLQTASLSNKLEYDAFATEDYPLEIKATKHHNQLHINEHLWENVINQYNKAILRSYASSLSAMLHDQSFQRCKLPTFDIPRKVLLPRPDVIFSFEILCCLEHLSKLSMKDPHADPLNDLIPCLVKLALRNEAQYTTSLLLNILQTCASRYLIHLDETCGLESRVSNPALRRIAKRKKDAKVNGGFIVPRRAFYIDNNGANEWMIGTIVCVGESVKQNDSDVDWKTAMRRWWKYAFVVDQDAARDRPPKKQIDLVSFPTPNVVFVEELFVFFSLKQKNKLTETEILEELYPLYLRASYDDQVLSNLNNLMVKGMPEKAKIHFENLHQKSILQRKAKLSRNTTYFDKSAPTGKQQGDEETTNTPTRASTANITTRRMMTKVNRNEQVEKSFVGKKVSVCVPSAKYMNIFEWAEGEVESISKRQPFKRKRTSKKAVNNDCRIRCILSFSSYIFHDSSNAKYIHGVRNLAAQGDFHRLSNRNRTNNRLIRRPSAPGELVKSAEWMLPDIRVVFYDEIRAYLSVIDAAAAAASASKTRVITDEGSESNSDGGYDASGILVDALMKCNLRARSAYSAATLNSIGTSISFGLQTLDVYVPRHRIGKTTSPCATNISTQNRWQLCTIVHVDSICLTDYQSRSKVIHVRVSDDTDTMGTSPKAPVFSRLRLNEDGVVYAAEVDLFLAHPNIDDINNIFADKDFITKLNELAVRGEYKLKDIRLISSLAHYLSESERSTYKRKTSIANKKREVNTIKRRRKISIAKNKEKPDNHRKRFSNTNFKKPDPNQAEDSHIPWDTALDGSPINARNIFQNKKRIQKEIDVVGNNADDAVNLVEDDILDVYGDLEDEDSYVESHSVCNTEATCSTSSESDVPLNVFKMKSGLEKQISNWWRRCKNYLIRRLVFGSLPDNIGSVCSCFYCKFQIVPLHSYNNVVMYSFNVN